MILVKNTTASMQSVALRRVKKPSPSSTLLVINGGSAKDSKRAINQVEVVQLWPGWNRVTANQLARMHKDKIVRWNFRKGIYQLVQGNGFSAREVIGEVYDVKFLREWEARETRPRVLVALRKQMQLLELTEEEKNGSRKNQAEAVIA